MRKPLNSLRTESERWSHLSENRHFHAGFKYATRLSCHSHLRHDVSAALALADHSAKSTKNGSNQLEVQGKNVIKVLSVELEGINSVYSFPGVNSRVTIKSSHGPKGLFFAYLADYFLVSLDRHAAL